MDSKFNKREYDNKFNRENYMKLTTRFSLKNNTDLIIQDMNKNK